MLPATIPPARGPVAPPAEREAAEPPQGAVDPLGLPDEPAAPGVSVHLLRLGLLDDVLRFRSTSRALLGGQSPDDLARVLAELSDRAGQDGLALHSTSWRFEQGGVVLTYAVFPDPTVHGSWSGLGEHVAIGEGPVDPSPQQVSEADVAAHAARHLADLAGGRDPHLVACVDRQPQAWQALLRHAGRVHAHPGRAPGPDLAPLDGLRPAQRTTGRPAATGR